MGIDISKDIIANFNFSMSISAKIIKRLEQTYNFEIMCFKAPYPRKTSISHTAQPINFPTLQRSYIKNSIVITL